MSKMPVNASVKDEKSLVFFTNFGSLQCRSEMHQNGTNSSNPTSRTVMQNTHGMTISATRHDATLKKFPFLETAVECFHVSHQVADY